MANKTINAPRGTADILPKDSYKWQFVENLLLDVAQNFGFNEIRTPTFEHIDLFCRGVGDTTDVVQKEMYEVKAQKGKDLYALRPEGTAGVVRSALERGLLNDALPLKVAYITACFRHERPQAGRLREFHQFGCEVFGATSPAVDVEVISLVKQVIDLIGLKNIKLNLNSCGCPNCRGEYNTILKDYLQKEKDCLCGTCLDRFDKNPMRILDCKSPQCSDIANNAPVIKDHLCGECKAHFDEVIDRLTDIEISYKINTKVVRGLDYYTKTVFEFISEDIGSQGTVFGGGRYDGLVEQLGGKSTAGIGFGMGIERLLMVMDAQGIVIPTPHECDLYIASMGEKANKKACQLVYNLRQEGFFVMCDVMDRGVKAQMKYANKIGAKMSIVLGDSELESKKAKVKIMETGEEREVNFETDLVDMLYDARLAFEADMISEQIGDDAFEKIMNVVNQEK